MFFFASHVPAISTPLFRALVVVFEGGGAKGGGAVCEGWPAAGDARNPDQRKRQVAPSQGPMTVGM